LLPTTIYHFSTLGIVWSLFVVGPPTDEFLKNALLERVGMVVGITVGLGSLYIMWCNRREKSEKIEESKSTEKPQPAPKPQGGPELFD
jgi:hypothetical protein